jgi:HEPN domain-containing protein
MTEKKKARSKARQHARVEILSIAGNDIRIGPGFFFLYAGHYFHAAKAAEPPQSAPDFQLVRLFLVCRTLELLLKAFLSLKGCSLEKLSGGAFGHDLKGLLEEAEKQNLGDLIRLKDDHRAEIVRASEYYFEKVLEYPALMEAVNAYPRLATASILIEAAETLMEALRQPCLEA